MLEFPTLFQTFVVSINTVIGIGVGAVLKKLGQLEGRMTEIEKNWAAIDARCKYEIGRVDRIEKRVNDLR